MEKLMGHGSERAHSPNRAKIILVSQSFDVIHIH